MTTRRQFLLFKRVSLLLIVGAILISCGSTPTTAPGEGALQHPTLTPAHGTSVSQGTSQPGTTPKAGQTSAWIAADAHLHGHGCGGQRNPKDLYDLLQPASLNIASALVWGQGYEDDRPFFTGQDWEGSTPDRIIHYDLEVSAFAGAQMGHQVILGLSSLDFPDQLSSLPIADWAHEQGAVDGFAHAGSWPAGGAFPVAGESGNAPFEAPIHAAIGTLYFLEVEQVMSHDGQWSNGITALWYPLLNSGFAIPIVGGSDYPCIPDGAGSARTLFLAEAGTGYAGWLNAIRTGQTVVAGNRPGWLDINVNGQRMGSTLDVASGEQVEVLVSANLPDGGLLEIIVNSKVQESASLNDGESQTTFTLPLTTSAWIAARAPGFHTSPIYVLVEGKPIRASASDADYFVRFIDDLLRQIDAGAFTYHDYDAEQIRADFAAVRDLYLTARDVFAQRSADAQQ